MKTTSRRLEGVEAKVLSRLCMHGGTGLGSCWLLLVSVGCCEIGGNKYRIIAAIHCNRQLLYVRNVYTHKEYDAWQP
ncbi:MULTISPECIES: type II toxin-antitoxin system HigB family toxin [unclassified Janthinobacterium]|uniref:type II toxin-antitoxin system HigB family toxin n=2 Tax=Janthinobacterium TaxID=29580 RepID=UPI001609840B